MRIVEVLEGKGMRMPLTKGECELNDRLSAVARQVCSLHLPLFCKKKKGPLQVLLLQMKTEVLYGIPAEGASSRITEEGS